MEGTLDLYPSPADLRKQQVADLQAKRQEKVCLLFLDMPLILLELADFWLAFEDLNSNAELISPGQTASYSVQKQAQVDSECNMELLTVRSVQEVVSIGSSCAPT